MKIYFSASISGGRRYLNVHKKIVAYLISKSHNVLTEHIVSDKIFELEKKLTPNAVYQRDIEFLNQCDVVIAEISNPSLGVGYEICHAQQLKKSTLCLYQKDLRISWMILGNTSPFLQVAEYETPETLFLHIDEFLDRQ